MAKDVEAERVACTSALESGGSSLFGDVLKEMLHGDNPIAAFKAATADQQKMSSDCLSQFPNLSALTKQLGDFEK